MTLVRVKRVLLVAAENDALHGAKVGGMADVIRDLPPALAACSVIADVAMPNYGFLAQQYRAAHLADIEVNFAGQHHTVAVYRLPRPQHKDAIVNVAQDKRDGMTAQIYLFDHPLFNHQGKVYCSGSADRPFAQDATKFALFSLSVATCLVNEVLPRFEVLHLHDWHSAMVAMLRGCVDDFCALKALPCVFTIHNLALQGIRPFNGDDSSFSSWFPQYMGTLNALADTSIFDPRYNNCINPMRMGIVLSDKVHLVSPSYAQEVLMPSDHHKGFFGGEGLEADLVVKSLQGHLVGIINGCVYEDVGNAQVNNANTQANSTHQMGNTYQNEYARLLLQAENAVIKWQAKADSVSVLDSIALARISQYKQALLSKKLPDFATNKRTLDEEKQPFLLTSVGRLTEQKVLILLQPFTGSQAGQAPQYHPSATTVLEAILQSLKRQQPNGVFMMLGSGDVHIAKALQATAARYDNFVFLHGYDEDLSEQLYQLGNLFLMPSSFEPCGISQMLAMRAGQPCLVHGVGGLNDTIDDNVTGWVFNGTTLAAQGEALVARFTQVVELFGSDTWEQVKQNATQQRFTWDEVAKQYIEKLYVSN
ncbi:glycogen synthase [Shewanella livingstonensis]|uniref:starch synthase n=1 Tax=Shewanella livingstonensis TaxID=150120 RepID=A0A3G8LW61_9GAMM|nr:glycogen/starch synthase [Shewanella livingstonensis]AZG73132.1 glycogen synthase [Shewanella livingstonensis]